MGYAVDFYNGYYKNDLNIAIADTSIERDNINSGYVYSNIDNVHQNPILQILFVIGNIKATTLASNTMITVIFYCNKSRLVLLNDWKNPHYFTAAFFYLFLFRNKRYLKQWKRPISLEA